MPPLRGRGAGIAGWAVLSVEVSVVEAGPCLGTCCQCVVWPMALRRVWTSVALTLQFPCFSELWEASNPLPREAQPRGGHCPFGHAWVARRVPSEAPQQLLKAVLELPLPR